MLHQSLLQLGEASRMAGRLSDDRAEHGCHGALPQILGVQQIQAPSPSGPMPARRVTRYRLCDLVDAMSEPVWVADVQGSIVYANRAWVHLGMTLPDPANARWDAAVHPDDLSATQALWAGALQAGLPFQCSRRVNWRDAGHRPSTTNAVPLRDQAGHVLFWCGIESLTDGGAPVAKDLRADEKRPGVPGLDVDVVLNARIGALMNALVDVNDMPADVGTLYSQSVCLAILARLGNGRVVGSRVPARRASAPLPKWRLARVLDYVANHVGEPVRPADLAKVAGLTRMYFAAQFRAAMGVCPHDYLLTRRIQHAQRLLRDPRTTLVEVALDAGFQTQSHFTTVFKRHVGETPHRWRSQQSAEAGDVAPGGSQAPWHGGAAQRQVCRRAIRN